MVHSSGAAAVIQSSIYIYYLIFTFDEVSMKRAIVSGSGSHIKEETTKTYEYIYFPSRFDASVSNNQVANLISKNNETS